MAVIKPLIFTSIADAECDVNRPTSEEVVRKMIQNANMLGAMVPVGKINCVALNQLGVTVPNTDVWQLANGDQITHPSSPITTVNPVNRFTPNFVGVYFRGASSTTVNGIGGAATVSLEHNHGGFTAFFGTPFIGEAEDEDEQPAYTTAHIHSISNDLSATEPLELAHQQVAVYLKIN